jgi:hypothetical protein
MRPIRGRLTGFIAGSDADGSTPSPRRGELGAGDTRFVRHAGASEPSRAIYRDRLGSRGTEAEDFFLLGLRLATV